MTLEKMMKGPLMWAGLAVILVFAFGTLLWDLASDQAEQRVRGEQSTQSHIEYAEDRIDDKCLSLDLIPLRDCIHKEIESARDHARANQDLDAQQSMAFFTKIMAWTTAGGLVLGAVSIAVIVATLSEMGRTNSIMRYEQRPWLVLTRDIGCDFRDHGHGGSISWSYDFENKGKGPAYDAKFNYTLIKRSHFQHMKPQLSNYLEDMLSRRRISGMAVLFSGDVTNFIKRGIRGHIRYQHDDFSMDPTSGIGDTMMMACLTYRLAHNSDEFGYDVRMFSVEESKQWLGPWGHNLIEYAEARLIG